SSQWSGVGKRVFGLTLCAMLPALCLSAQAQQAKKIARIAYIFASTPAATADNIEAFRQGMRELGHVEGKTFVLELRYGQGRADRFPEIARELVGLKLDMIVAATDVVIAAVKRENQTIPVIMASSNDPVATRVVASLPR